MYIKYLITVSEPPVAMKFNVKSNRCIIGGHPKNIPIMESVVRDYFKRNVLPRKKFTSSNKVRFEFQITGEKFYECLHGMREYGVAYMEVATHGRLMR